MAQLRYLTLFCALLVFRHDCTAQELKTVVRGHIDSAVRDTKVGLGIPVELKGETAYFVNPALIAGAKNLTFVLSGRDLYREINPFVKIGYKSNGADGASAMGMIGTTESAGESNNSDPNWTQSFWFMWKKGTGQIWTFRLFDHKNEDRLIAEGELDVDRYVERQESNVELGDGHGKIIVEKTTPVKFKLSAKNIRRADEFNGKSDPYVKSYYRTGADGKDTKFYTTTTIDNVDNADWGDVIEFTNYIPLKNQYLHFKLRDADSWTRDDHLGEVMIMADAIFDTKLPQTMYLENSGEHSTITIVPVKVK